MSSTRQTVTPGDNLIGFGNIPVLTPAHQVERLTGIRGGLGGLDLGLPMIWESRTNPDSGKCATDSITSKPPVGPLWPAGDPDTEVSFESNGQAKLLRAITVVNRRGESCTDAAHPAGPECHQPDTRFARDSPESPNQWQDYRNPGGSPCATAL